MGIKHSEAKLRNWKNPDYRRHMSEVHRGKKSSNKQKEVARKLFTEHNPMKNPDIVKKVAESCSKTKKGQPSKKKGRKFPLGEKHWMWKGGVSNLKGYGNRLYGDDWFQIRSLILKRDNYKCQKCMKIDRLLHIHHKIPFLESVDNSLENLITLCPKCHREEEIKWIMKSKFLSRLLTIYQLL